jgi:hypothetical protein
MSVFEQNLEFSDAQALGAVSSGGSVKSANTDNLARSPKDAWGTAKALEIGGMVCAVQVHTALVGAGATVIPKLVTKAANASISSGATVIATLPTIAAVATAGTKVSVKLPPGTTRLKYLGMIYTISGAKLTSATVNAQLRPGSSEVID